MKHYDQVPFHRMWFDPAYTFRKGSRVYVAPVDTAHLLEGGIGLQFHERMVTGQYENDLREIAAYARNALIEAWGADPEKTRIVVDSPSDADLIFEMSIVELIPSKPALEAAGLFVTGLSTLNNPSVAFEARSVDRRTGKVVATFADREVPPLTIVADAGKYSWYHPARRIIDDWAEQFVEVAKLTKDGSVSDTRRLRLLNW